MFLLIRTLWYKGGIEITIPPPPPPPTHPFAESCLEFLIFFLLETETLFLRNNGLIDKYMITLWIVQNQRNYFPHMKFFIVLIIENEQNK